MKRPIIITIFLACLAATTLGKSSDEDEELVLFRQRGTLLPTFFLTQNTHAEELKLKQCNYDIISPNSFSSLPSLKKIEIDKTTIAELPQGAFSGCNNLKELVIRNSKIDSIDSKAFNNLSNISKLKIKTTKIGDLKNGMFSGCSKVESFTCEECGIETVEEGALDGLGNLKELDLQRNGMKKFSFAKLPVMPNLKKINLSYNPLSDVDVTDIKTKCPNLEVLRLNGVNLPQTTKQLLKDLKINVKKN